MSVCRKLGWWPCTCVERLDSGYVLVSKDWIVGCTDRMLAVHGAHVRIATYAAVLSPLKDSVNAPEVAVQTDGVEAAECC